MKYLIIIIGILLVSCSTVPEVEIKYVKPEIPESISSPCEPMRISGIETNGSLLMAYLTLHSQYSICAAKLSAIVQIIESYDTLYGGSNE